MEFSDGSKWVIARSDPYSPYVGGCRSADLMGATCGVAERPSQTNAGFMIYGGPAGTDWMGVVR